MKTLTRSKGLAVLVSLGVLCSPLTMAPALAADLPASAQAKENSLTGSRTSATTLNIPGRLTDDVVGR